MVSTEKQLYHELVVNWRYNLSLFVLVGVATSAWYEFWVEAKWNEYHDHANTEQIFTIVI